MKTALNQSSNTFYAVFKSLPIPSYIWQNIDNDFDLVDANELAINDFSYKKNVTIGVKASEFYSNVSSIIDDLKKCIATKSSFERIVLIPFDDNSTAQFSLHQFTFIDEKTVLVQTKEIKNEQPLFFDSDEYDQLLATFIQDNPIPISMLDNDLRYIATSKNWLTRFKLEDVDLKGKYHFDIFPEINDDWKGVLQRCLNGAVEKRDEDAFVRGNGEVEWVKWEVRPWYKKSKEIGGIMIFSEVITERKNAQEKIKKDAEKLNQILENLPFGLSIEKKNNEITFFNKTLIEMLGYDITDAPTEEAWFQKVYPNEKYRNQIRKIWDDKVAKSIKTNQRCEPIESVVHCKDGSVKIIESYYFSIGDEFVTLVQDITDIRNKEFQIKEVNEVIIQQNNELLKGKKTS